MPALQQAGSSVTFRRRLLCNDGYFGFGFADDIEFTKHLIREIGSPSYLARRSTTTQARLAAGPILLLQKDETLEAAPSGLPNWRVAKQPFAGFCNQNVLTASSQ